MRLTLEGFGKGWLDEKVITKTGIMKVPPEEENPVISNCPAVDLDNVDFYPYGTLNRRPGFDDITSSPWTTMPTTKIYQYTSPAGSDYCLVFSPSGESASAAIATMALSGAYAVFTSRPVTGGVWAPTMATPIDVGTFGGSAVMCYGGETAPLVVFTGSTYCYVQSATPSGAAALCAWGNFLFIGNIMDGGVRYGSRLRWCYPGDIGNWPASYYLDLDADDGDVITSIWLLKEALVVFKRYKTFIVRWVGGTMMFDWQRVDASIGCVGPNALLDVGNEIYFISADGPYKFNLQEPPTSLIEAIERSWDNVNSAFTYRSWVDYFEDKNQVFFCVPTGTSEENDTIFVYCVELKSFTKFTLKAACSANILYGEDMTYGSFPNPYYYYDLVIGEAAGSKDYFLCLGDYNGHLFRYGYAMNDGTSAVPCHWMTPWIDFGDPDSNKKISRMILWLDKQGNYDLTVGIYRDWDDETPVDEFTVTMSGSTTTIEKKIDFVYPGRIFKFKFSTDAENTTFTMHKVVIEYLRKGRTLVT